MQLNSLQSHLLNHSIQNLPLPKMATETSPTASSSISPTDSIPSISSLPCLTSSSSSTSEVWCMPTLTAPAIPKDKLGEPLEMEGNRNQLSRTMSQLAEAGYRPVWSREHGYPGVIPEDIGEYLDSNSYRKQTYIYFCSERIFLLIWF